MSRAPIAGAVVVGGVAIAVALGTGRAGAEGAEGAGGAADARAPVLVELFTSEGCSSCPPADAVLARLEDAQPVPGALVVPLAHHVDYWDSLGWPDPFASRDATARQRSYGGNYTPQAIVDGAAEVVGSKGAALERAIADAAKRPHVKVTVKTAPGGEVTVASARVPGSVVRIALVQARAKIAVPRGENAGRTLEHTAIVRAMKTGPHATFPRPKDVAWTDLRAVAFVQDERTRRVLGSAQAAW